MILLFSVVLIGTLLGLKFRYAVIEKLILKWDFKYPILNEEKRVLRQYYGVRNLSATLKAYEISQKYRLVLCVPLVCLAVINGSFTAVVALGVVFFFYRKDYLQMKAEIKKRKYSFLKIYPQFLNHLKMYLEAGVTLENSMDKYFSKPVEDYYLMILKEEVGQIKQGKNRQSVFLDVSQRVCEKEMIHLMNFFIAHLQFGTEKITYLDTLMEEAWRVKKETIKKLGEEASAKMVFPMMCIFLAVTILTIGPSVFMFF